MSQHSKNLLEAFKASGTSAAQPVRPAASVAPAPGPAAAPRVSLVDVAASRDVVLRRSQVPLLVVVAVLALVCAFVLGRASVGVAAAAKPEAQPDVAQPQAAPAAEVPAAITPAAQPDSQARSPAEQALLDPRNLYTIKVVEYYRSELNTARALETLRYLTDVQGLPACSTSTSTRIYVLVGAARTQADFDQLLPRVKTLAGPPPLSKPAEFHDAYIEKIDKVFPRQP